MSAYEFQPPFTYHRDREGCNDLWMIDDADGANILTIPFWDDVPNDIGKTEAIARRIVKALNAAPMGVVAFGPTSKCSDCRSLSDEKLQPTEQLRKE